MAPRILRLSLLLLVGMATALPQTVMVPDTPAGKALQAWMEAFNSGDRAKMQAHIAKFEPSKLVEEMATFRAQTGGFQLLGIDRNEKLRVHFRAKEAAGPTTAIGKIEVKDGDPAQVVSFSLRAIPPGMTATDMTMKLDAGARGRVIDGAIAKLNESYVFPETAKKMESALRARQKAGEYDRVDDAETFASMLTEHLRAVSHDKHLGVNFYPKLPPMGPGGPAPDAEARMRARMEKDNCAFEKVERLPSNIGYLKFNAFLDPAICGPTATAAMNFLANVDAIIFDLRGNGGGDPNMIAYLSTYLFKEPTHLNDLYNRKEDSTTQYWTLPYVSGKRLAGQPVYVLTSKRSFSGAEEFTYNLKNLKRATIIGETTGGGAHPVSGQRIDDHFMIGVPFARAVNPISRTNWEGTGVEPDVKVPAEQALDVALRMAGEKLKGDAKNQ